jgi:hypothetical protein
MSDGWTSLQVLGLNHRKRILKINLGICGGEEQLVISSSLPRKKGIFVPYVNKISLVEERVGSWF